VLDITVVRVEPRTAAPGDTVEVTYRVRNTGNQPECFKVNIWWRSEKIGYDTIGTIPAGFEITDTKSFTMPDKPEDPTKFSINVYRGTGVEGVGKPPYCHEFNSAPDDFEVFEVDKIEQCTTGCEVECQSPCETGCQTLCQYACERPCEITCQTSCEASCQESCERSCMTGCEGACQEICQSRCQESCESLCQSACEVSCQVGCEVGCQQPSELPCATSCEQGMCQTDCELRIAGHITDERLLELFGIADDTEYNTVMICYNDSCSAYATRLIDPDLPPGKEVVLCGDLEWQVLRLFRFPDTYSEGECGQYFREKFRSDPEFRQRYWNDPYAVRHELRVQFKDSLLQEARAIINAGGYCKVYCETGSEHELPCTTSCEQGICQTTDEAPCTTACEQGVCQTTNEVKPTNLFDRIVKTVAEMFGITEEQARSVVIGFAVLIFLLIVLKRR